MPVSKTKILCVSAVWDIIPFADLVSFQEGPGIRKRQHRAAGIPFLNIRCMENGRITRSELRYMDSGESEKSYAHFLLEADDILVSSSGTLGKVAQITAQDLPCLGNTGIIRMHIP